MSDQYVIYKYIQGSDWEYKTVVCIVDTYELAMSITEYLNGSNEDRTDGDGNPVCVEYWVTSKKHMSTLDDFVKWWEGYFDA